MMKIIKAIMGLWLWLLICYTLAIECVYALSSPSEPIPFPLYYVWFYMVLCTVQYLIFLEFKE